MYRSSRLWKDKKVVITPVHVAATAVGSPPTHLMVFFNSLRRVEWLAGGCILCVNARKVQRCGEWMDGRQMEGEEPRTNR